MSKSHKNYQKLTHVKLNKDREKQDLNQGQSTPVANTSDKLKQVGSFADNLPFGMSGSTTAKSGEEVVSDLKEVEMETSKAQKESVNTTADRNLGVESQTGSVRHVKQFVSVPKSEDVKTPKQSQSKLSLPKFLSNIQTSLVPAEKSVVSQDSVGMRPDRALALAGEAGTTGSAFNPNSFSSIFNKEHQEISGIQRVFKKSIGFLLLNLTLFGLIALVSVNLFTAPIWLTLLVSIAFISCTNLFFIIVADRSYVWLGLAGMVLLLLLVHSFLGQGFAPVTLISAAFLAFLVFSAYSELEKVQLGSRLFSISHVTTEPIRILSVAVITVLSLGLFNSILAQGTDAFLTNSIFGNRFISQNVIFGPTTDISLSRALIKSHQLFGEGNTVYTFRDFLEANYKGGRPVLTDNEFNDLVIECETQTGQSNSACEQQAAVESDRRLVEFRREAYPRVAYELDEVLDENLYPPLVEQHYIYLAKEFNQGDSSSYILIPRQYILPAVFAIGLFFGLMVVRTAFNWLGLILTWILWQILRLLGFVKIEVEVVEAEIVSI